jgi:cytochrome c peroxidase
MHKRPALWGLVGGLSLLAVPIFYSCQPELPEAREVYLDLGALQADYGVGVNNEVPALGRVLFYDRQMSINNSISCASCHKQALAFADNVAFSRGFENRLTARNSMPIQNLIGNGFSDSLDVAIGNKPGGVFFSVQPLFWDGRDANLESMVMRPVVNHVEMGITSLEQLEDKIRAVPYYKELFLNAYGSDEITATKIAKALGFFLQSIRSNRTKLDRSNLFIDVVDGFFGHVRKDSLSAFELLGQRLFVEKYDCNSCHQVQDPHGYLHSQVGTFSNIGLDAVYADNGLGEVTGRETDNGKFKIPSLRNVALTAPYMHDGRFETLSDVIDHYSNGLANHPNLDHKLRDANGDPMKMNISANEKHAIIAFLNTLTDHQMISDPKFSDPFKSK